MDEEKIKQELEKIRKPLQADGGDIELMEVKDGVIKVKLKGACAGCPFSQMTLKNFVEEHLRNNVDGVERVEAI